MHRLGVHHVGQHPDYRSNYDMGPMRRNDSRAFNARGRALGVHVRFRGSPKNDAAAAAIARRGPHQLWA